MKKVMWEMRVNHQGGMMEEEDSTVLVSNRRVLVVAETNQSGMDNNLSESNSTIMRWNQLMEEDRSCQINHWLRSSPGIPISKTLRRCLIWVEVQSGLKLQQVRFNPSLVSVPLCNLTSFPLQEALLRHPSIRRNHLCTLMWIWAKRRVNRNWWFTKEIHPDLWQRSSQKLIVRITSIPLHHLPIDL